MRMKSGLMVATVDDLVDTLHRKIEHLSQGFEGFTGSVTGTNLFIALLSRQGHFRRRGVEIQES